MAIFRRSKRRTKPVTIQDKDNNATDKATDYNKMRNDRRSFSVRSASSMGLDSAEFEDFDVQESFALQSRQDTTSGSSPDGHARFDWSRFVARQHKAVMDKLTEHVDFDTISVSATLQSLVEGNACQAISDVPRDIQTYYHNTFAPSDYSLNTTVDRDLLPTDPTVEPRDGVDSTTDRRTVSFGYCLVREYNRTVGDHPDVSDGGPPLTITWDYIQLPNVPVGYYEAKKKRRRRRRLERRSKVTGQPVPHIPNLEMTVPRIKGPARRELLWSEFDVPAEDLRDAEDHVRRTAELREDSCTQSVWSEKTEELLQSAQRKLRRSLGMMGSGNTKNPPGDDSALYNATIADSCSGSTQSSTFRKRSTAGFAASLRVEALRRQMGGCVGVGPNSKYGIMSQEELSSTTASRGGPEPDGMGGWKRKPKSEDSPIVFLGLDEKSDKASTQ